MSGYSEDLTRKGVVSAVEEGMSKKAQAARTFSVSLSSVKHYVNKADGGESLELRRKAPDLLRSSTRRPRGSLPPILRNVPTPHPSGALRLDGGGHEGAVGESLYHVPCHIPDGFHEEKGGRLATESAMSSRGRPVVGDGRCGCGA
jgi:hypothetical protein